MLSYENDKKRHTKVNITMRTNLPKILDLLIFCIYSPPKQTNKKTGIQKHLKNVVPFIIQKLYNKYITEAEGLCIDQN